MRLVHITLLATAISNLGLATPLLDNSLSTGQQPLVAHQPAVEDVETFKKSKKKKLRKALTKAHQKLLAAEIIPSVVDDFEPWLLLNVTWPNGKTANLGNSKKPSKISDKPYANAYAFDDHHSSASSLIDELKIPVNNLVITLTDPDAPSHDNPAWGEMCHWIGVGLQVHIDGQPSVESTEDGNYPGRDGFLQSLVSYKSPGPPPFTGAHRYIFIAWTPANKTTFPLHLVAPSHRQHWGTGIVGGGVKDWARAMGLQPFAANFLYSQDKVQ